MPERYFVTGGSRGIGREVVSQLCSLGHKVDAPSRSDCDMGSIRSVTSYQIPDGVTVMVLCAGTMGKTSFFESQITADGLDQCFQINFVAPALLCLQKPASVHTIVFVSSQAANFTAPNGQDLLRQYATSTKIKSYAASKCCMHIFFEVYRQRFPGTRCVCVDPGNVHTELVDPIYRKQSLLAWLKRKFRGALTFTPVADAAKLVVDQQPMVLSRPPCNTQAVFDFVETIHLDPSFRDFYRPIVNNEQVHVVALAMSLIAPHTNLICYLFLLC